MRTVFFVLITLTILFMVSCRTTSKLVLKDIQIGMTKNQVMRELGMPFKRASSLSEDGTKWETLYYKEEIYLRGLTNESRIIESILYFENDTLVEIEQGEEFNPQRNTNHQHWNN